MQLNEFFNYKNQLMKDICSDRKIVELITDETTNSLPNFDLRYTKVFPYEFIPETVEDGSTFVCFDVDIDSVESKTVYSALLYVWVFTHKSKMRLSKGGVRTDELSAAIDKKLNGSRMYGLGELDLKAVERFSPITDYQGRVLVYSATDFNRAGVSHKPPSKRGIR